MRGLHISLRWWLALAFALIAGLTALAAALISAQRGESAFRQRSDVLALGDSLAAALGMGTALREAGLQNALQQVAGQRRVDGSIPSESLRGLLAQNELEQAIRIVAEEHELSLFLFDAEGSLVSSASSRQTSAQSIPGGAEAVAAALEGRQYVASLEEEAATVVAVPLFIPGIGHSAVLTTVPQPEFQQTVGIFRGELVFAAIVAVPIGAFAGLLVAMFIGWRLRRIAGTAAAIEGGDFDTTLQPRFRFRDELGSLALSIDRMRQQLRQSFAQLEFERDRLDQVLERLHEGVVTVNSGLEVELANAAAHRAFDLEGPLEGEPLPEPWEDVSLRQMAASLFRPDAKISQARVAPDELRTYALVGIPAGDSGDSAVFVITDISEQERREQAEREFVTNAAHELKTPLAAISGAVEVLQAGAKEIPDDRDVFLGHIERESARLGRLARALLVLARAQTNQEAPKLGPIELGPLLHDVAASLRPKEGVRLSVECEPELAALTERDLIEQVVANLGENAAKHTEQGSIELSARRLSPRRVVIEVRDSGSGIPSHERERVFDQFYRGSESGAGGFGLGLAIVRQSVRALGGTVTVNSATGEGTSVRVTLPVAGPQPRFQQQPAAEGVS